jgi:hypothetical protein
MHNLNQREVAGETKAYPGNGKPDRQAHRSGRPVPPVKVLVSLHDLAPSFCIDF